MTADSPVLLCEWDQFASGAFQDLARNYVDPAAQGQILAEATRLCEQVTGRRLVPFAGMTETHRATGIDPDEYPAAGLPISASAAIGQSYADALGADDGVRHVWLNEFAARYPEMWCYTGVSVSVVTTYGGAGNTAAAAISGPEPDSGHVWFSLGTWVPIGSLIRITYGGGYAPVVPADLTRAAKLMVAQIIMRELQPTKQTRDPNALWDDAVRALGGYIRE